MITMIIIIIAIMTIVMIQMGVLVHLPGQSTLLATLHQPCQHCKFINIRVTILTNIVTIINIMNLTLRCAATSLVDFSLTTTLSGRIAKRD